MSKFYLQFIVSLVVAFFAPLGVAASESANPQNSSSGISLWEDQASLGVSTRLGQTTRQSLGS